MRIIVTSDTHLAPYVPAAQRNWDAVVRHVAAQAPDLVLHLGDLSYDGMGGPDDLRHARAELDRLGVPVLALPGNHDVGDNPAEGTRAEDLIDDTRLSRWRELIGPDHFSLGAPGFRVIGLNAQLYESGLADEDAQWAWLERELSSADAAGERIVLLTHKPLSAPDDELARAPTYRYAPLRARTRLNALLAARLTLPLVLSGHVHQYRVLDREGARHLWAPTTWAVLPESAQPTLGTKRCGILSLELSEDGSARASHVEPAGMVQFMLDEQLRDTAPFA